jgi:hypothetical protein
MAMSDKTNLKKLSALKKEFERILNPRKSGLKIGCGGQNPGIDLYK